MNITDYAMIKSLVGNGDGSGGSTQEWLEVSLPGDTTSGVLTRGQLMTLQNNPTVGIHMRTSMDGVGRDLWLRRVSTLSFPSNAPLIIFEGYVHPIFAPKGSIMTFFLNADTGEYILKKEIIPMSWTLTTTVDFWSSSSKYAEFPYEYRVALGSDYPTKVIPSVVLPLDIAMSGKIAPICEKPDNSSYVRIYSKDNTLNFTFQLHLTQAEV